MHVGGAFHNEGTMTQINTQDATCVFEKKHWISITGLCNNNCTFCLDTEREDTYHKPLETITSELMRVRQEGAVKLTISGGEPTIHPQIVDIVAFAKHIGFSKIQVVSNGRMFSSQEFTRNMIDAGLTEVTFSIHGHTSQLHDGLTRAPNSLKQIVMGIKHIRTINPKFTLNTDTCITKTNYTQLVDIISFIVEKLHINEINLMSIVPQGNAWFLKNSQYYTYEDAAPYVHQVIEYCEQHNVILWLSRFPSQYLEGYERYMENPYKRVDDVRGHLTYLRDTTQPSCKGRCSHCSLNNICEDLIKINDENYITNPTQKQYKTIIQINQQNSDSFTEHVVKGVPTLLSFITVEKELKLFKQQVPQLREVIRHLQTIDFDSVYVEGIPQCVLDHNNITHVKQHNALRIDYSKYINGSTKDYLGLTYEIAMKQRIKPAKCNSCIYHEQCKGIQLQYARAYGFSELTPKLAKLQVVA